MDTRTLPYFIRNNRGAKICDALSFEKHRRKIASLLGRRIFGRMPDAPRHLHSKVETINTDFAAGEAALATVTLTAELPSGRSLTLPVRAIIPRTEGKHPAFIFISRESAVPSELLPAEEIINRGFGIFVLYAEDVATHAFRRAVRAGVAKDAPGLSALIAFAAGIVADYALSHPSVDESAVAVIGHAEYAMAALLCAATERRISYAISSCAATYLPSIEGAASLRAQSLFCSEYAEGIAHAENYDPALLFSLIPPRHLVVGSAEGVPLREREWECEALDAVRELYSLYGAEERIKYHYRHGTSYLSRRDWNVYMDYIEEHSPKS